MPLAGRDGHEDAVAVHNASAEEAMPNLQADLLGASHSIPLIFGYKMCFNIFGGEQPELHHNRKSNIK